MSGNAAEWSHCPILQKGVRLPALASCNAKRGGEYMKEKCGLFFHTVLLGVSAAASKAVTFLLMPFYTAALSPEDFGAADLVVSTAVLLLPFVTLHAGPSLFRFFVGAGDTERRAVASTAAVLVAVGSAVFLLLLPLLRFWPVLNVYRFYLLFYVLIASLHGVLTQYLRATGAYTVYAFLQPLTALCSLSLQIFFIVSLGLGARGYLLGIILSDAAASVFLLCYLRPWEAIALSAVSCRVLKKMLFYGLPLIPGAAFWWLMSLSDRYFILHYHSLEQTGLYAAAARIPALFSFLLGVFLEAWQYSALQVSEREARTAHFARIYRMLLPVSVLGAAALLVLCVPLVSVLFAPAYREAVKFVPFLVLAALFSSLSGFFGTAYQATLRSLPSFFSSMLGSGVNLLFNFLLIPRLGAMGAALATLVAYFAVFLLRACHTATFLHFPRYFGKGAVSLFLLLLTATCVCVGALRISLLSALLSVLPFWREGRAVFDILLEKWRFLLKNYQKYKNRS
ncbi:MAG: hypothetical protein E7639_01805 [Ruminococcaceae bacterium]|nr:hypothetical protein [Oscillospiraceae bacterium]